MNIILLLNLSLPSKESSLIMDEETIKNKDTYQRRKNRKLEKAKQEIHCSDV